jgi:DNA-directed RNA polymerase beta subunit
MSVGQYKQKTFKRYKKPGMEVPNLVKHQLDSYDRFLEKTIVSVFKEINPISDYSDKKFDLIFKSLKIEDTEHDDFSARRLKISLEKPLKAVYELVNKTTGETKKQEIFMFHVPVLTKH